MSIQDLGNLGEFIAALATLGTLVYLTLQIRQNTKSVRASTYHDVISDFAHGIEELNRDADLNRIWFAGARDFEVLSQLEQQRFATYITAILRRYENILYQTQHGSLELGALLGMQEHMKYAFSQHGTLTWWNRAKNLFNPELQRHVEEVLMDDRKVSTDT